MKVVCDVVHYAVGANEASPAIMQLRITGAINAPHGKSYRRVSQR